MCFSSKNSFFLFVAVVMNECFFSLEDVGNIWRAAARTRCAAVVATISNQIRCTFEPGRIDNWRASPVEQVAFPPSCQLLFFSRVQTFVWWSEQII